MHHHPFFGRVKALRAGLSCAGVLAFCPLLGAQELQQAPAAADQRIGLSDPQPYTLQLGQYAAETETYREWGKSPAPPVTVEPEHLFNEGELFLDVFGAFANGDEFELGDVAGGGAGLGYFFTRHLAVYGEAYVLDAADQDVAVLGGLMVRLPMDDFATAFYAFAEYGGTFGDRNEPSFQFGAGVDVRLTYGVSFFADARGIQNRHTSLDDGELFRVGLRFIF